MNKLILIAASLFVVSSSSFAEDLVRAEIKCTGTDPATAHAFNLVINRGQMTRKLWMVVSGLPALMSPKEVISNQETVGRQTISANGLELSVDTASNGSKYPAAFVAKLTIGAYAGGSTSALLDLTCAYRAD